MVFRAVEMLDGKWEVGGWRVDGTGRGVEGGGWRQGAGRWRWDMSGDIELKLTLGAVEDAG